MLSNKPTAAKTCSGTVIRVWVICASLLCCVASKLTHVAQPKLTHVAISVISVNGWHELFELHSYRCNID
jgi:hypothetical protein